MFLGDEFDKARPMMNGEEIRRWSLLSFRFVHSRDAMHEDGRLMKLIKRFNVLASSGEILPVASRLVELVLGVVGTVESSSSSIPREIGRFLSYAIDKDGFDPLGSGSLFQAMWRISQEEKSAMADEWSSVLINILKQCMTVIGDKDVQWTPLLQIDNVWEEVPAAKKILEDPILSYALLRRLPLEREGHPIIVLSWKHARRMARNWTMLLMKVLEHNTDHSGELWAYKRTRHNFGFMF
jgi:hypothetical protein